MGLGLCCSKCRKKYIWNNDSNVSEIMTRLQKMIHRLCCEQLHVGPGPRQKYILSIFFVPNYTCQLHRLAEASVHRLTNERLVPVTRPDVTINGVLLGPAETLVSSVLLQHIRTRTLPWSSCWAIRSPGKRVMTCGMRHHCWVFFLCHLDPIYPRHGSYLCTWCLQHSEAHIDDNQR